MSASPGLSFTLRVEGADTATAELRKVDATVSQVGKSAALSAQGIAASQKQLDQYGQSARATAAALRQVPAQFTDIVTGLASGQSPLAVLLQQGGQLKDLFGGVGNAARALGGYVAGLINPLSLAAAAAAGLAVAYVQGSEEARDFERALINTGNAAATTAGELREIADRVADTTGATRGGSAAVLADLTSTGRVTAEMLEKVAATAVALERTGGQAAADTVKQFAALGKDPVDALKKLDEQSHFLTSAVLEQVQALVEQGRAADAARLAQTAYADVLLQRIPQIENQLGTLQTAWRGVKDLAKSAWDAMLGIGRDNETTEQKLRAAQARVAGGDASARGDVAVWQAKLDAEKQSGIALEAANIKRRAELGWLKEGEQFRTKQQKMEAEIAKARELGVQAGKSEAELMKRIGEIREKYAEKTRAGGTRAPRADPLDAELEHLRTDLLASEAGLSSTTIKAIDSLTEALRRGKVAAAEYDKLLGMLLDKDSVLRASALRDEQSRRAQEAMAGSVDNLRNVFGRQIAAASERDRPQADRDLALSLRQVSEEADRAREALSQKAASLRTDDLPALEAYRQAMVEVAGAEAEQIAQVKAHHAEQELLNSQWETGASRALARYAGDAKSVADQTEEAFTRVFTGMEDALLTFLTAGKLNFKEFAASLIADLARIQLKALLTTSGSGAGGGLGGLLGWLGSKFGGGSSPLPSFDIGSDYVPRDMVALIHRGERIIPAAQNTPAGGSPLTITVNVNAGASTDAAGLRRSAGLIAREVAGAVRGTLRYG